MKDLTFEFTPILHQPNLWDYGPSTAQYISSVAITGNVPTDDLGKHQLSHTPCQGNIFLCNFSKAPKRFVLTTQPASAKR